MTDTIDSKDSGTAARHVTAAGLAASMPGRPGERRRAAMAAEAALWARLLAARASGDTVMYRAAQSAIVGRYQLLVDNVVTRMKFHLARKADRAELLSDAYVGLLDAIERFEPGRGILFSTFATQRMRGAMYDGLRERRMTQRQAAARDRRFQAWMSRLEQAAGRPVGLNEAAAVAGVPVGDLVGWAEAIRLANAGDCAASTGQVIAAGDGDQNLTVSDTLLSRERDPSVAIADRDAIEHLLRGLLPETRRAVYLYHVEGLTMLQIAGILGRERREAGRKGGRANMSESRVSELISAAMRMLKAAAERSAKPP